MNKSIQHYFGAQFDYFWQWEDGGEVIAIPGGTTICYREQLVALLSTLSPGGLPPLGSVLLVLAAMGPHPAHIYQWMNAALSVDPHDKVLNERVQFLLNQVEALPPEYKAGFRKAEVLRALFRRAHNRINADKAHDLLADFRKIRHNSELYTVRQEKNTQKLYNDFRVLSLLASTFSSADDIKRAIAELPVTDGNPIPLPEEPEMDTAPQHQDFVDELMDDTRTFPVGALIRRIWSGLNIPFHNQLPSEQPMGGVSDISNKGDFHRLLTTEFANDDIVFLSRLANNEALYINREVPPQSNKKERIILIDISIRNWGTPKTIAYALLQAIARHPKTDIPCSAYVVGEDYKQIGYSSIDEIVTSLMELEGSLHPGNGVRKFLEANRRNRNMELILITNPDTIQIPGLAVAIQDYLSLFKFWLVADAEGSVDVYRNQKNSRKHVQRFVLPLEELWSKKRPRKARSIPEKYEEQEYDFPILFPGFNASRRVVLPLGSALYVIAPDKCLYKVVTTEHTKWENRKGWELVQQNVKYSNEKVAIGHTSDGQVLLFTYSHQHRKAWLSNIMTGAVKEFDLSVDSFHIVYTQPFFFEGRFLMITKSGSLGVFPDGATQEVEQAPARSDIPAGFLHAYEEWRRKAQHTPGTIWYTEGFLKNFDTFAITRDGELLMNKHVLNYGGSHVNWKIAHNGQTPVHTATKMGSRFYFTDSTFIDTTPSGIIVLHSDQLEEPVFIPTGLESALGLATKDYFCGKEFYRGPFAEQKLVSVGEFYEKFIKTFIQAASQK